MFRVFLAIVIAGPVAATELAVPSGIKVRLFDVILEEEGPLARFRLVAPDIDVAGAAVPFSTVAADFQHLCDTVLLPGLLANGWSAGEIVVSYASAEIPFGEIAPEVTQYFQPFSVQGDTCHWEDF
jgi:hypothetical protein